jgi:hypothetical protein
MHLTLITRIISKEWMDRGLTFWWYDRNWKFSVPPIGMAHLPEVKPGVPTKEGVYCVYRLPL